jgi:hypothetical protein
MFGVFDLTPFVDDDLTPFVDDDVLLALGPKCTLHT